MHNLGTSKNIFVLMFFTLILHVAPQKWKKAQVVKWIYNVCEQFEIEKEDVSKLTTLSGAGLMKLKRQDWLERCPAQGDLFFNLWAELLEQSAWERGSDATQSPPNSPRKGTTRFACGQNGTCQQAKQLLALVSRDGWELLDSVTCSGVPTDAATPNNVKTCGALWKGHEP